MTMVVNVAQAILGKVPSGYGMTYDEALDYARAAIEATREPTDAMRKALLCHREGGCGDGALYHIVIDAALNEQVAG